MSGSEPAASAAPAAGSARGALRGGWRDLWRWPAPTSLALLAATTATLALRAGWQRAAALVDAADAASPGLLGRAALLFLVANLFAALLVDVGFAVALSAYAGAPPPLGRRGGLPRPLLMRGLRRTPAMITIRALELALYYTLAVGELVLLGRALGAIDAAPGRRAALATLTLAPAILLSLYTFVAARVAQTLIARGLGAALALTHGLDVALRRFGTLARLGLTALLWTLPLWATAPFLPSPLSALLLALAALWSYAALVRLVGADGRLRGG